MMPCERYFSSNACPREAAVMVRMHSRYVEMVRGFYQLCADAAVESNDGNPEKSIQFQIIGPMPDPHSEN